MQKVVLAARVAGEEVKLSRDAVEAAARSADPEPLRDHYVVVAGQRYPPKQVLALVTGIDRSDFTTLQARSVLRRLGFSVGRLSGHRPAAAPPSGSPPGTADALRTHRGRWVALRDDDVLVAADRPEDVLAWLERHDQRADTMFRVPLDAAVDLGGFPS